MATLLARIREAWEKITGRDEEQPSRDRLNEDVAFLRRLAANARSRPRSLTAGDLATSDPSVHEKLKCGEDVVGYVAVTGCDNFHILGRFWVGPDFGRYEDVLRKTYHSFDDRAPGWSDALDEVDTLGLYLEAPRSGEVERIRDFQLEGLDGLRTREGVPIEFKYIGA